MYIKKNKTTWGCASRLVLKLIGQTTPAFQQKYTTFWDVEADISFGNKGLLPGKCRGLKLQGATHAPHVYIERPMVATKGHETQEPVHAQSGCRRCPVFREGPYFSIFRINKMGSQRHTFVEFPDQINFECKTLCIEVLYQELSRSPAWRLAWNPELSNQNPWIPGWTYQRCGASGDFGRRCRAIRGRLGIRWVVIIFSHENEWKWGCIKIVYLELIRHTLFFARVRNAQDTGKLGLCRSWIPYFVSVLFRIIKSKQISNQQVPWARFHQANHQVNQHLSSWKSIIFSSIIL